MAKYKGYDHSQGVLIPISLEEQLMPGTLGTLEFAIHTLVETRVNTSIFDSRYDNEETEGRFTNGACLFIIHVSIRNHRVSMIYRIADK